MSVVSIITGTTCGFNCWYAKEDICRCSCGGKNHGALLDPKRGTPERIVKIQGKQYRLEAVGSWSEIHPVAARIQESMGWAAIRTDIREQDGTPYHQHYTAMPEIERPIIVKKATDRQYSWPELKLMGNRQLYLLWVALVRGQPLWCDKPEQCKRCRDRLMDLWAG